MNKIVFMGTPEFAIPCLEALLDNHEVALVVSQPDRPSGRGRKVRPTPVKKYALKHNIEVFQPNDINSNTSLKKLKKLEADFFVVVAYGQIVSKEILSLPNKGTINVHASLLPEYRGGAPIHRAILDGKEITGVTTMLVEPSLDTGPILMQEEVVIKKDYTTGELHDRLADRGAKLLIKTLENFYRITPKKQCNDKSSYAKLLDGNDRIINWEDSALDIYNKVRGLNPWPLAFTKFNNKRLIVTKTKIVKADKGTPGEVVKILENGPVVKAGDNHGLILLEVKPQGKSTMTGDDFLRGYQLKKGDLLK